MRNTHAHYEAEDHPADHPFLHPGTPLDPSAVTIDAHRKMLTPLIAAIEDTALRKDAYMRCAAVAMGRSVALHLIECGLREIPLITPPALRPLEDLSLCGNRLTSLPRDIGAGLVQAPSSSQTPVA